MGWNWSSTVEKLGVFFTVHLNKGYRHGVSMENHMLLDFQNIIKEYVKYNSGVLTDYFICDTGSTILGFDTYIQSLISFNYRKIPNLCGAFASMKYVMNHLEDYNYDYYLFTVDDTPAGRPQQINWAIDLIQKQNNKGLLCRFLDTIKMGPNGLVDHRFCCSQMAKIWNINEDTLIPHAHANWYLIDRESLTQLAKIWYEPISSIESMNYQRKWEETDFCILADMNGKNRKILDDIHIGREVDISLRMNYINKECVTYDGILFWPNAIEEYNQWKTRNTQVKGFYGEWK